MPVWHKATQEWRESGKLVVLGLIQEQHAERCRLYAQWQKIGWPIVHDPINIIGSTGVPIFVAIDEHGIVRSTRPKIATFEKEFINRKFAADDEEVGNGKPVARLTRPAPNKTDNLFARARKEKTAAAYRTAGDAEILWRSPERVPEAIKLYSLAAGLAPDDPAIQFRLGVAYRAQYDNPESSDPRYFQKAVDHWGRALALRPNQYIWRRRIQQYGPRLTKPYKFYDWVHQARREIKERGETPIALKVEPSGAEFASPSKKFSGDAGGAKSPDPDGKIRRDLVRLIRYDATVVPAAARPGQTVRVHVVFRPSIRGRAHWNNEAEPLRLWMDMPKGFRIDRQLISAGQSKQAESTEPRSLEFEVKIPNTAKSGKRKLAGYVLYYVCEDAGGKCMFLRRDVEVVISVLKK